MSNKFPFAVLAIHPNSGIEIMAVLANSHQHALTTAAKMCIERHQPDLSIVAALSLTEINNIQKILDRADFIGEGNGMQPKPVELQHRQLDVEYGDFEDEFGFYDEQNDSVEQIFPTRKRDLYDLDEHGTPQPKGTVAAAPVSDPSASASKNKKPAKKSKKISAAPETPKAFEEVVDQVSDTVASLRDLDLSQGKKTNDGKSNVFLDDYYED